MRPQDVELMHKLWLNITADPNSRERTTTISWRLALEELQRELGTEQRAQLLQKLHDRNGCPAAQ